MHIADAAAGIPKTFLPEIDRLSDLLNAATRPRATDLLYQEMQKAISAAVAVPPNVFPSIAASVQEMIQRQSNTWVDAMRGLSVAAIERQSSSLIPTPHRENRAGQDAIDVESFEYGITESGIHTLKRGRGRPKKSFLYQKTFIVATYLQLYEGGRYVSQERLAEALDVSIRTLQYWLSSKGYGLGWPPCS